MNRRILTLFLPLLAIPAISQAQPATVVVLDRSYSMTLPSGNGESRGQVLLNALDRYISSGAPETAYELVAFEDVDGIDVVVPYPATASSVLAAAAKLVPWGTSPVIDATVFGLERALVIEAADDLEIVLVTDGEDDQAYLAGDSSRPPIPESLESGKVRLNVITLAGTGPGVTSTIAEWASASGGTVVAVAANGEDLSVAGSVSSPITDHEISAEPGSISPEAGPARPIRTRSVFGRVVAAWLLVLRLNLAGAGVLGCVALVLALMRWRRRAAAARRHNSQPTKAVLEVRTSLRRQEHIFERFPITVGTAPGSSLPLQNGKDQRSQSFRLNLADGGLRFHSETKLNVNGVPRADWELAEGDQIRVGKYRVVFVRLVTTTPLPPPRPTYWTGATLAAVSLAAAALLFVFRPLPLTRPSGSGYSIDPSRINSAEELARASESDTHSPADAEAMKMPDLYDRGGDIDYFDADFMVIHAHPDDETLDCGTLIARMDAAGMKGVVVLLTDGQSGRDQYPDRAAGGDYPPYDLAGDSLVRVRVAEARRAMAHLGVEVYVRGRLRNFPYNAVSDQLRVDQVLDRWGGLRVIEEGMAEVVMGFSPELVISPDGPWGPYEHFEHEAVGVIVASTLESLRTSGHSPVRAHIMSVDPLQTEHYTDLIAVSPWETNPKTGASFRASQISALFEHKTQRDASKVGIETRLAMPAEYYAVGFWDPAYSVPSGLGIGETPAMLSVMALPPDR